MRIPDEKHLSHDAFKTNCCEYLKREEIPVASIEVRLDEGFVQVAQYWWDLEEDPEWVVGGDCPYLGFNGNEIKTPQEALAMYSWFMREWVLARGAGRENPDGPHPLVPPNWIEPTYSQEYDRWLYPRQLAIIYDVLPFAEDHILHPEIRDRCFRLGVRWKRSDEGQSDNTA